MRRSEANRFRAEVVAAWTVGFGIGLMTLMLTWLVGNRLVGLWLESPGGPTVAFSAAVALGFATTIAVGMRLAASIVGEQRRHASSVGPALEGRSDLRDSRGSLW